MRPCPSTGTRTSRLRPKPTSPSALISVGCASSPITTVIGGAPKRPSASTSQPWPASTACRAAASALKLAIVAPVTKAAPQPAGSAKRSRIHSSDDLFQPGGRGRHGVEGGVLIPGRREPVRRQRRRQRPADDEAEEARAGDAHRGRRADLVEQCEHFGGVGRMRRERLAQGIETRDRGRGGRHRSLLNPVEIAHGTGGRVAQQLVHETPFDVTRRTPRRTLRSSRIARRRRDAHDRRA